MTPVAPPVRLMLTIPEAADELRMSDGFVKKLIREKTLATKKLGTRTRIERAELLRYIESLGAATDAVPESIHDESYAATGNIYPVQNIAGGRR